MDDSFELEYADELDALGDDFDTIDTSIPHYVPPKSKRSLEFKTPQGKKTNKDIDNDICDDLSSPFHESPDKTALVSSPPFGLAHAISESRSNRKRLLQSVDDDDDDTLVSDLPKYSLSNSTKRLRLVNEGSTREQEEDFRTTALIEQIQQHRSLHNSQAQVLSSNIVEEQRVNDGDDIGRPRVCKRIPKGDFISTVGYDGSRVFMKLWDEEVLEAEYLSLGGDTRFSDLLNVPVCVMREQIEDERSRRILEEAIEVHDRIERELEVNASELLNSELDTLPTDVDANNETLTTDPPADDVGKLTGDMKSLWVEKYAPQKYTELLSEENINRSLLHWLKLWDYVVFNKNIPKPKKVDKFKKEKEKEQKYKFKKFQTELTEQLDKNNRPEQKIALLCGPPGLGKTTLANIVAQHAGYNVVEMNASDDRSAEVFRNKLESATQMKSVNEADPRPNCLVIDEIDGAPTPAINVLLNTIKKADNTTSGSKKKKEGGLLSRPIICVCNDQYVPALRQLRQNALILNFPQTESSKLASRLHEVVKIEQLQADLNALLALCERTDNDIRSCLNTLQFVRQKQRELTLRDIQTMSVGQKDTQKSLFSVWNDVFTMPRQKKNRFISIHDLTEGTQNTLQSNNITPSARFQHILDVCQSAGEHERVMQGLYENYLEAKSKDPKLLGLTLTNEWLCFADCSNQYIARSQDYSVLKFLPFVPVVFHFLYASFSPSRVQFPHLQADAFQGVTKTNNLLSTMVSDMAPIVRKFVNPRSIVLDLLPPLMDVLQPNLRPVNTQLYSAREKEELQNVVRIMMAYNMTYHQEKSPEGQYVYALDPNVEEVVRFSGMKQRKQLTYAAKQMIAREIELEKMRKSEGSVSKVVEPQTEQRASSAKTKASPAVPNHLQKLEARALTVEKPAINFFGNFIKTKRVKPMKEMNEEPKQDTSKKELLDTIIWFHFKEGFSNAVRRNVKIQDLL